MGSPLIVPRSEWKEDEEEARPWLSVHSASQESAASSKASRPIQSFPNKDKGTRSRLPYLHAGNHAERLSSVDIPAGTTEGICQLAVHPANWLQRTLERSGQHYDTISILLSFWQLSSIPCQWFPQQSAPHLPWLWLRCVNTLPSTEQLQCKLAQCSPNPRAHTEAALRETTSECEGTWLANSK